MHVHVAYARITSHRMGINYRINYGRVFEGFNLAIKYVDAWMSGQHACMHAWGLRCTCTCERHFVWPGLWWHLPSVRRAVVFFLRNAECFRERKKR